MEKIIIIFCISLLTGCSTIKGFLPKERKVPDWPWVNQLKEPNGSTSTELCSITESKKNCDKTDSLRAFVQASNYCAAIYDHYREDIQTTGSWKGRIGFLGSLMGIAGTTTSGTSAKFLSGFSGATNAFQASANEMFTATATFGSLTSIQELVGKYNTAIIQNINKSMFDDAVFNSVKLAGECKFASSVVQNRMVNSVVAPNADQQSDKQQEDLKAQITSLQNQVNKLSSEKDKAEITNVIQNLKKNLNYTNKNSNSILNISQLPNQ
ncbi:hypothetical protein FPL18_17140 [Acinetobacter gyllenbergii]|nr:hypothetical protein FPL18_17140 [Acinetobacter gyllenbergii]